MPDERTHDIYHVDEPEGYDAMQEVTAKLEQAEAESDDLMKRLHSLHKQATVERSHFYVGSCAKDAMHRIEKLEAKSAKAVEALGGMVGLFSGYSLLLKGMHLKIVLYNARAALAELKGKE